MKVDKITTKIRENIVAQIINRESSLILKTTNYANFTNLLLNMPAMLVQCLHAIIGQFVIPMDIRKIPN